MNKKGFTLIEILVSIGLLALLETIIEVSLNKSPYRLIEINELINNGYINKNLINPNKENKHEAMV